MAIQQGSWGFTLVELLVVIGVIALLATLLLPALARAKMQAQAIKCLNNLHQFGYAWLMYAEDHNDVIPPNNVSGGSVPRARDTWVIGWLQPDFAEDFAENTNTL